MKQATLVAGEFRCRPSDIGRSREGRRIVRWFFRGQSDETALVLAGVHGDEPKGVFVARQLIELLHSRNDESGESYVVVPLVNPDGYYGRKRRNANAVDLNRNFPTANWEPGISRSRMYGGPTPASEPETRAVISVVKEFQPTRIVTIHSISGHRQCNNYDGPGRALARKMSHINGYPVSDAIGYPTPGSFGHWAGVELGIATITLELPSHHSAKRCWEDNRLALRFAT